MKMWVEISLIVLLTIVNGLFAGAEIAILSVRKTRLQELAAEGNASARALQRMREQPERFLATVQIGITVVSATAAAFGGATLVQGISAVFERSGLRKELAEDFALAVVVVLISYSSLVLGELVPKSLALRSAEKSALLVARPLLALLWLARPAVWFLTASSNAILRIFRDQTTFAEARLSKEELQQLVDEAATAGSVDRQIGAIAYRALDFGDIAVSAVMSPRADMVTLSRDASKEDVRKILITHGHTRTPVYEGSQDNIVGYATARDLVALLAAEGRRQVRDIVRPALFVPESRRAADVLTDMQQKRDHLALVVDDVGAVSGLVTLEDLLEELVGEIFAEHETPVERFRRLPDGTVLVRGRVPVHEVNRELGLELSEGPGWTTLAGLAIALAGEIPRIGARLEVKPDLFLEVLEASDRRVLLLRIVSSRPSTRPEQPSPA
jgi:putative hemolysin